MDPTQKMIQDAIARRDVNKPKAFVPFHVNKNCKRCGGTNFVPEYRGYKGGVCFLCNPDA
ncbi:hypothetical protein [Agarivorans sp. JK6]|uniref:hypothetical protein n=1 Tax=Agarivorans sp. JK6 TaxID=2997426 RepID=UPI0038737C62